MALRMTPNELSKILSDTGTGALGGSSGPKPGTVGQCKAAMDAWRDGAISTGDLRQVLGLPAEERDLDWTRIEDRVGTAHSRLHLLLATVGVVAIWAGRPGFACLIFMAMYAGAMMQLWGTQKLVRDLGEALDLKPPSDESEVEP